MMYLYSYNVALEFDFIKVYRFHHHLPDCIPLFRRLHHRPVWRSSRQLPCDSLHSPRHRHHRHRLRPLHGTESRDWEREEDTVLPNLEHHRLFPHHFQGEGEPSSKAAGDLRLLLDEHHLHHPRLWVHDGEVEIPGVWPLHVQLLQRDEERSGWFEHTCRPAAHPHLLPHHRPCPAHLRADQHHRGLPSHHGQVRVPEEIQRFSLTESFSATSRGQELLTVGLFGYSASLTGS